jgi:hypothetical protein
MAAGPNTSTPQSQSITQNGPGGKAPGPGSQRSVPQPGVRGSGQMTQARISGDARYDLSHRSSDAGQLTGAAPQVGVGQYGETSDPPLQRWVGGGGSKGAMCSLDISSGARFCPFAKLFRPICGHTSKEIVGIAFRVPGGLY